MAALPVFVRQHKSSDLPVIVSIVFCHDRKKWELGKKLSHLIPGFQKDLAAYVSDFEPDDKIRETALSRVVMLVSNMFMIPTLWKDCRVYCELWEMDTGLQYLEMIIR